MNKEITPGEIIETDKQNDNNINVTEVTIEREDVKKEKDKTVNDELIFRTKKGGLEVGAKNITEKTIILTVVILLFLTIWIVLLKF